MTDDDFEWDDDKAAANVVKHCVDFEFAKLVFGDRAGAVSEDADGNYGERRFIIIGLVGLTLITVVYTERGDRTRIISARKSNRYEQRIYDEG